MILKNIAIKNLEQIKLSKIISNKNILVRVWIIKYWINLCRLKKLSIEIFKKPQIKLMKD
jgi:hypothetical protein